MKKNRLKHNENKTKITRIESHVVTEKEIEKRDFKEVGKIKYLEITIAQRYTKKIKANAKKKMLNSKFLTKGKGVEDL